MAAEEEAPLPETSEGTALTSAPKIPKVQRMLLEARAEPKSACLKIYKCFCGSVVCGIILLFVAVLPVAMIVIGSYYVHQCPLNTNIPIYLIVFGCVSIVQAFTTNLQSCLDAIFGFSNDESRGQGFGICFGCFNCLITVFSLVWFIIGSYWIFSAWIVWTEVANRCHYTSNGPPHCCNPVLMYFAFVFQLLMYGLILLFCCSTCMIFGIGSIVVYLLLPKVKTSW